MPTVLRVNGFRVLILFPPREHPPPHVHVVRDEGVAVIRLESSSETQRTIRIDGMSAADRRKAEQIVKQHTTLLMDEWRRIHG